ncbi:MAG: cereblon family protein [Desulforegulaceae bacterium]|nr:cereblon family protein [Desulforegulaceae bacterium]
MITLFKEPEDKTITRTKTKKSSFYSRALLCKNCLNEITSENFAIEKNNSHTHSFANPYGYIFTIRCFSLAPGLISTGDYSPEFSWFKDYSWRICACIRCMTHFGWEFSNSSSSFFGLIDDKLI